VILPEFRERRRKAILTADAKPVPPGFRFASNSNHDWLDAERLQGMIAESEK
jgi:hypothetical protein